MTKTPTLTTERLVLRPPRMSDAPAIQRYFPVWEVVRNLSEAIPWPYPDDGAEVFLKRLLPQVESGAQITWVITIQSHGDECVGLISYQAQDEGMGHRGFWLAVPFQGHGYMTEAVIATQVVAARALGLSELRVLNARSNTASRRVKEKSGAILVGEAEAPHRNGDQICDVWQVIIDELPGNG